MTGLWQEKVTHHCPPSLSYKSQDIPPSCLGKCRGKDTLKEYVQSVLLDADMKENIAKVQKLIRQAPGNQGGAEVIIDFYKNMQGE